MPSAKRAAAARAATAWGSAPRPEGRAPSAYPIWDGIRRGWTNEAGEMMPKISDKERNRNRMRTHRAALRRDATMGRELLGLTVYVPFSALGLPGQYAAGSGELPGLLWDYVGSKPGKFVVRFPDVADAIRLSWSELFGEVVCGSSSCERARLIQIMNAKLTPQPSGPRPRNAVWDQREAAWVNERGIRLQSLAHTGVLWSTAMSIYCPACNACNINIVCVVCW